MTSQADIANQMRQAISIPEPTLDTTIGTPIRAIVDAVAQQISLATVDQYLGTYIYDVNSKTGSDLDNFCAVFGMTRYPAKAASGQITFSRQTAATQNLVIQPFTQIQTIDGSVIVSTTVPAVLVIGQTQVTIPVIANTGGSAGNVTANSLTTVLSGLTGFSTVTNIMALSNGSDAENDAQLRQRFKTTIFRNMSGTKSMYLGLALNNPFVTRANVLGASETWREQIQIINGVGTSTIPDAQYIYAGTQVFGASIDSGQIAISGIQYNFNPNVIPPTIQIIGGGNLPDGVYDLTYKYVSTVSRNVPTNGITNRIDVYVDGVNATPSTETLTFLLTNAFNNTAGSPLNASLFLRNDSSTPPQVGNYFIKYFFCPVVEASITGQLSIGGQTWTEGIDYYLVNDVSPTGGTYMSNSGIEFVSNANGQNRTLPPGNTQFTADAIWNRVPADIAVTLEQWNLVCNDAQVHQALRLLLNVYMAVIILPGYTLSAVQAQMSTNLSAYLSQIGYVTYIQVSEFIQVALNVPGVVAARFLTSIDNPSFYAIQSVSATDGLLHTYATTTGSPYRATDIVVGNNQVPVLNALTLTQEAQNTFGAL